VLLGPGAAVWARRHRDALPSEAIAAAVNVMTSDELSFIARTVFNPHEGAGVTIGSPHHCGSRIQPNSPGDNDDEILFSILEGLCYGCGDVIIGLNPASDDVDSIVRLERLLEQMIRRLELPTRFCVLSDIVKQRPGAALHARRCRFPVQGILIGWGLAFVTAQIFARVKATKINGWITMFGLGVPGNGFRAVSARSPIYRAMPTAAQGGGSAGASNS
jgi:Ethanolamine ammonia lyase large subunit (EutB)